jgi:pimeloyl-ACP methyl ester carboxylesterase
MKAHPVLSMLLAALGSSSVLLLWRLYRAELARARERVASGSHVVLTPLGAIEYAQAGRGAALLAVHGAGGGFDQGLDFAGSLAGRGFRVVATSRFGYLRTPLPDDASPAAQADAHAALLDALGIDHAAVLAGSAGAPSALQFAIRYPHRCSALVLLVPLAYAPPVAQRPATKKAATEARLLQTLVGSDFVYWLASKVARDLLIETVLATPAARVHAATLAERQRIDRIIAHILPISLRAQGLLNDARIAAALPRYELERIKAPTLVFSARDDRYGTFAAAQYCASAIAGASFVDFETGGHTWVGRDGEILSRIAAFVSAAMLVDESRIAMRRIGPASDRRPDFAANLRYAP